MSEKFEGTSFPQEKKQLNEPSPEEIRKIENEWLNEKEHEKRINFGEVSFDKENKYFKLAGKKYPILFNECIISDPKGEKTNHEWYGFGYVQKERVIPKAYTEFFSRFVEDDNFNGKNPIYFSKDGFSTVPTPNFITINNEETGEITGTIKSISSAIEKFSDDNGNIEYKRLKFEYLKSLLNEGPAYSNMYLSSEDGITYYYGNVRLEGNKIFAEILNTDTEKAEIDEVELDMEETLYALSSSSTIGKRLVEKIHKILSDFEKEKNKSIT